MSSEHAIEQVPLPAIREGDMLQDPKSGNWIKVTHTSEGNCPEKNHVVLQHNSAIPTGAGQLWKCCHDALANRRTNSSSPKVFVCWSPLASRPKNVHCPGLFRGPLISLTV